MSQDLVSRAFALRVRMAFVCSFLLAVASSLVVPAAAVAQASTTGWSTLNIGAPAVPGFATATSCSEAGTTGTCSGVAIVAGGLDIWGGADQFVYMRRQLTGDGSIVARFSSVQSANAWTKAGLMVRDGTSVGARNSFVFVTPGGGVGVQRRLVAGGGTTYTSAGAGSAPIWLRLDRVGTQVYSYRSADGVTWVKVGTDTITLNQTVQIGVAVAAHDPVATAKVLVSTVSVSPPLPPGWLSQDVGAPVKPGSATYDGTRFVIQGAGTDIFGASDQFRYTYQTITGDVDIVARVASLVAADAWAKAGVMLRASAVGNAPYAALLVTNSKGLTYQRRAVGGAQTISLPGGTGRAPFWVKIERRGKVLTALQSRDGAAWAVVSSEVVDLPETVLAGLAVTGHGSLKVATATFDNVKVARVNAVNIPPTVSLLAPVSGSALAAPATLALSADATDADGTIAKVEFYNGPDIIGTTASRPYSGTWSGVPAGSHWITAVAYDNAGAMTRSTGSVVTVLAPPPPPSPPGLLFAPSPDHDATVDGYLLEIYSGSATLPTGTAVVTLDIGKPAVVGGDCAVDVSAILASLPAGSYVAVVTAINAGGRSTGAVSPAFTR